MKTKTFDKKLSLNRKTVANLDQKEMQGIYGGETDLSICITNCFTVCITNCASVCPKCPTLLTCTV